MSISKPVLISFSQLLLIGTLIQCTSSNPSDERSPTPIFINLPNSAKPIALWTWVNGYTDLEAITREMESAKTQGLGGMDIWDVGVLVDEQNIIPAGPPFLSDSSLMAIAHAVEEGDRLDLDLGLVLSSSWNAGGHWIPAEHGAMGLYRTSQIFEGGKIRWDIPFPELPQRDDKNRHDALIDYNEQGLPTYSREVAVLAVPWNEDSLLAHTGAVIDLSASYQNGILEWEAPAGSWLITRYVCAPTGQPLSIPSPRSKGRILDHFSREAMQFNLDYIFERLESKLGKLDGRSLKYLYTDSYEVNSAVWTPKLPELFESRMDYSLIPYLPLLDGFTLLDTVVQTQFTHDFTKTLSDLIIENHYAFATEYCKKKGLDFIAEAGGPGPPVHNVPFEDLKALGALSVPRGEFWNRHPRGEKHTEELQIIKGIASAAHLYNQPRVEAESFTSVWLWQEGPQILKPLVDRAFCEGLNKVVYHTMPHRPKDAGNPGWVYNFGTLVHPTNNWWDHSHAWNQYLGIVSHALQQGKFKGHVLHYYGDQAPNFVPPKYQLPGLPLGYDYDYINSERILNALQVRKGKLCIDHGPCYDMLDISNDPYVSLEVWNRISLLLAKGAWIRASKPMMINTLSPASNHQNQLDSLLNTLFTSNGSDYQRIGQGRLYPATVSLAKILQDKEVRPAIQSPELDSLDFIQRTNHGYDIFFVRNKSAEKLVTTLKLQSEYNNLFEVNTHTGHYHSLPSYRTGSYTEHSTSFASWQSRLYILSNADDIRLQKQYEDDLLLTTESKPEAALTKDTWSVEFSSIWGDTFSVKSFELIDWSKSKNDSVRFFSGKATYKYKFNLSIIDTSITYILSLGQVYETAKVWINEQYMGTVWCHPFQLSISDALESGINRLTIEVANTISNGMVGDYQLPPNRRRSKTNVVKGPNAWMMPWNEVPLLPSGLIGPVQIIGNATKGKKEIKNR